MAVISTSPVVNAYPFVKRLEAICSRVCVVVRRDPGSGSGDLIGTGFLIGPQTILTAYHVMDRAPQKSDEFWFDYTEPGKSPRIYHALDTVLADESPIEASDHIQGIGWRQSGLGLCYSAINLEKKPGETRGWLDLPTDSSGIKSEGSLYIFSHPEGKPMQISMASNAVIDYKANDSRVIYHASTLPGSSGGPCFNEHLQLIAMHVGRGTNNPIEYNFGVPAHLIRNRIIERGRSQLLGGPERPIGASGPRLESLLPELAASPVSREPPSPPLVAVICHHTDYKAAERLKILSAPLVGKKIFRIWGPDDIPAGADARSETQKHCQQAMIILVLVTPELIGATNSLTYLNKSQNQRIMPVILRPCLWKEVPILSQRQPLPRDEVAIQTLPRGKQDRAWQEIAQSISTAIMQINS